MLKIILCALIINCVTFGYKNEHDSETIEMIFSLFRHGNRSPTTYYPNDPYLNYKWPGGKGALSQTGALQLYTLGEKLRRRYYNILPQNGLYSQEEIIVLSSFAERCIMSAQSLFAGFLPPLKNNNALPITWQPVPVNVLPWNTDIIIEQSKPCPKYDELIQNLFVNPPADVKLMNDENRDLYDLLTKRTGMNISTIDDIMLLYNTLEIEKLYGFTLPDWTKDIFPKKMLPLAERGYTLSTETPYIKKIKGGAFLTEIVNNMVHKRNNTLKPDRKMFFYAGHDVTLINVMNALSILDQTSRKPDFASALIFELHHSFTYRYDFEVKIVYYDNSDAIFPKEINIPNCPHPCSLTQFIESVKYLLLEDDFDKLC